MRQIVKVMRESLKNILQLFVLMVFLFVVRQTKCAEQYEAVDGDSLEKGYIRIRLQDIDAPELFQYCFDKNEQKYYCGKKAHEFLQRLIVGNIDCESYGKDRYGRQLMECFDKDGRSINQQMVLNGWALSYSDKYSEDEIIAKKMKKGIWQGRFMRPELFRALQKKKENSNKIKKR